MLTAGRCNISMGIVPGGSSNNFEAYIVQPKICNYHVACILLAFKESYILRFHNNIIVKLLFKSISIYTYYMALTLQQTRWNCKRARERMAQARTEHWAFG